MLDRRLLRELRPERGRLLAILLLQGAAALCAIAAAAALARAVDGAFLNNAALIEAAPSLTALLFAMLARAALDFETARAARRISRAARAALRRRLLARLLALGPTALAGEKTGALVACLTEGVDRLDDFFAVLPPRCAAAAAAPPLIALTALCADPLSGALLLVTAPLILLFMALIGKRAERANAAQWRALTDLGAHLLDLLEGVTTLKIFGRSRAQYEAVGQMSEALRAAAMRVLRVAFLSAFALELIATLGVAVVAVAVGLRLLDGRIEFARAFFLLLLAPEFYRPLRRLGGALHSALAGAAAADEIYRRLEPANAAADTNQTPPNKTAADERAADETPPAVRFTDVRCAYGTDRETALDGLTFTAPAGRHTAIVGLSGAGKTTVLRLLLGFIAPQAGQIRLGSRPLETLAPETLRRQIAYLPQSPHIFARTAAENIALFAPRATREEIVAAAKRARLHDCIAALPEGYETRLGAGGRSLSGGQLQRLAIARAFLQNAPLLLLDEPLTGIDAPTGREVAAALTALCRGKTTLTVTHRLPPPLGADQIVVLDGGRAAEIGAPEELLRRGGLYAAFCPAEGARQ